MTGIGIIGCGMISRFHHEGFDRAGARIVHVCDIRDEAARETAAMYGAKFSTDYRRVLDDPEVELLSVLTTASMHKEICLAAIAAGKGIVCEKTLSDSPASSREIVAAVDASGRFFATAFMKRFFPAARKAKELLADMGPVLSIHARTWQPFPGLFSDPIPEVWLTHPSAIVRNYGGGVLICGGSHILDLIHWFGGAPIKVAGRQTIRLGMDFEAQTNAMLWLPDGGTAHLECLWHPFTRVGYERNGWDERLEINTAQGRLDLYTVT